jgi:hypothetical protein
MQLVILVSRKRGCAFSRNSASWLQFRRANVSEMEKLVPLMQATVARLAADLHFQSQLH